MNTTKQLLMAVVAGVAAGLTIFALIGAVWIFQAKHTIDKQNDATMQHVADILSR